MSVAVENVIQFLSTISAICQVEVSSTKRMTVTEGPHHIESWGR